MLVFLFLFLFFVCGGTCLLLVYLIKKIKKDVIYGIRYSLNPFVGWAIVRIENLGEIIGRNKQFVVEYRETRFLFCIPIGWSKGRQDAVFDGSRFSMVVEYRDFGKLQGHHMRIDSTYYKEHNKFWGGFTLGTVNGGFFGMCGNEINYQLATSI